MMKRLLLIACLFIVYLTLYAAEEEQKDEKPLGTTLSVLLNRVKLSGYGQVGYTYNSNDGGQKKSTPTNTFDLKRIMFVAEAEVFNNMTMFFMYDFGAGKTHEIWGEYKFCEELKLRGGQFKVPFSLENVMSPAVLEIISGTQSINYLSGIPPVDVAYGGNGGRDLGIMIHGKLLPYQSHRLLSYQLGVFNGQGINISDRNNKKDIAAWLMVHPLKEVSVGGSVYLGKGNARQDSPFGDFLYRENYKRNRWGISAEINTAPLYVRTEYLQGKDGKTKSEGYYALLNYHIFPKFDLIASYDYFAPNKDAKEVYDIPTKQTNYIVGTQWNFYRRCRLQVQYVYQDKSKGWKNSNLIMTQFQVGF